MKTDEIIERFARLTHSPQDEHAASNETYKQLLARLPENDKPVARPLTVKTHRWSAAASIVLIVGVAIACIVGFSTNLFSPSATGEAVETSETSTTIQTLTFNNEPLSSIVSTLAEAYNADIVIADNELATYCLTATFTTDEPLDEVLDILSEAGGFTYQQQGSKYIIH